MRKIFKILVFALATLLIACSNPSQEPEKTKETSKKELDNMKAVLEYKINAQLGEGPLWNYKTQELLWVDIEGKQLHFYDPKSKTNRSIATPSRIGTVVPTEGEELLAALQEGLFLINPKTEEFKPFLKIEEMSDDIRFNDGKCDPAGRLWVGTMHLKQTSESAKLYKIDYPAQATSMLEKVTISNGIVWTKDKKTMYYIDTPTSQIKAFDFDNSAGTISNERVAVDVSKDLGYPDGMTIDENDKLWVGLWNGNAVAHFDPLTGTLLSKIEVPAHNITACAFGGPDLDKLYITTASIDMTEEERQKYPDAGSVFVANPGVKGVKNFFFKN